MLACVIILSILPLLASAADWNYYDSTIGGPKNWSALYPTCNGTAQSPVNILTTLATNNLDLNDVIFTNYHQPNTNFVLTNNGHGIQLTHPDDDSYVRGAGLGHKYVLEQFHFHWGENNTQGSEHLIDGRAYPLEIHLVHYNADAYDSVTSAVAATNDTTGVAVFAIFVSADDTSPKIDLGLLTNSFINVPYEGNVTTVTGFAVDKLLPANRAYYRYNGSLTTPACTQAVVWTLFKQPININSAQMNSFRNFGANNIQPPLVRNNRPVQPLNGRLVYNGGDDTSIVQTTTRGNTSTGSSNIQFSLAVQASAILTNIALFYCIV